jgi:hypothetical protein
VLRGRLKCDCGNKGMMMFTYQAGAMNWPELSVAASDVPVRRSRMIVGFMATNLLVQIRAQSGSAPDSGLAVKPPFHSVL